MCVWYILYVLVSFNMFAFVLLFLLLLFFLIAPLIKTISDYSVELANRFLCDYNQTAVTVEAGYD